MIPKDRNEMARVCVPTKIGNVYYQIQDDPQRLVTLQHHGLFFIQCSGELLNCGIQSHQLMQVGTSILAEHHHMISILQNTPGMGLDLHVTEPTCHI